MKKKILFILNPRAGSGVGSAFKTLVKKNIDSNLFDVEFADTNSAGHATKLAANAVAQNYDGVVAVGGDGTVNEVACVLRNSKTVLAIIPTGSGNGLARHLFIPVNVVKALKVINNYRTKTIDTFEVNEMFAVNVAGIGFDAYVAHRFAKRTSRGFFNYIRCVASSYSAFQNFQAKMLIGGNYIETPAWMISFANSTQFGNNAVIAPYAIINDGVLDVVVCDKIPLSKIPSFVFRMFTRRLVPQPLIQFHKVTRTVVTFQKPLPLHIDGEPKGDCDKVEVKVHPLSLQVVC